MGDRYDSYRRLFASVDTCDPVSLYNWFKNHPHLSIYDHAQIMNKCTKIIRDYRIKAGLKGKSPTTDKRNYTSKTIGPVEIPSNWRDKEWLTDHLKKYTANALIRAIGVSRYTFYRTLKKLGVPTSKGNYSKNPRCTKAWCFRHYVELNMTMEQCAKLANISRPKFADWLVKFGIPVRGFDDPCGVALPLQVKQVIHQLRKQPCVQSVTAHESFIRVKWMDRRCTLYHFKKIPAEHWVIKNVPTIKEQYERDLTTGVNYPAHFIVKRSECKNLSVFERDIVLHGINYRLRRYSKWPWPSFPDNIIKEEWAALQTVNEKGYIRNGAFTAINIKSPGRRLMMHLFSLRMLYKKVFLHQKRLYPAIKSLYHRTNRDLSYYNIVRRLCVKFAGFKLRYPSPAVYSVLFKRIGIKGKVLDMHLGSGARALACAMNGLEYFSLPCQRFYMALEHGLEDITHIKHAVWNGKDQMDLIICDADFAISNVSLAHMYGDRAKRIIAYIPRELKQHYQNLYPPKSIIPIITKVRDRRPNFFFIW